MTDVVADPDSAKGMSLAVNWIMRLVLASTMGPALAGVSFAANIAGDRGIYLGAFRGVGSLGETSMQQVGTVLTPHPLPDINVDSKGSADSVVALLWACS